MDIRRSASSVLSDAVEKKASSVSVQLECLEDSILMLLDDLQALRTSMAQLDTMKGKLQLSLD